MLEKKILEDYQQAAKAKDALKASILSFLRSQLHNYAIEKKKKKLEDTDIFTVIKRLVKQHQDSIEQFQKGQRDDLVQKAEEGFTSNSNKKHIENQDKNQTYSFKFNFKSRYTQRIRQQIIISRQTHYRRTC